MIAGALMPPILTPRATLIAFSRGPAVGFGYWTGMLWITIPAALLFFWIGMKVAGG